MQFMQFLAIHAMLSFLATLVTLWYPTLRGAGREGCYDSVSLVGYERRYVAISAFDEARSTPMPKT